MVADNVALVVRLFFVAVSEVVLEILVVVFRFLLLVVLLALLVLSVEFSK